MHFIVIKFDKYSKGRMLSYLFTNAKRTITKTVDIQVKLMNFLRETL